MKQLMKWTLNIYDFFNIVETVQEDSIIILKTDATEILQNGSMQWVENSTGSLHAK